MHWTFLMDDSVLIMRKEKKKKKEKNILYIREKKTIQ